MTAAKPKEPELPMLRVDVVEPGQRARRDRLRCEIGREVDLKPERLVSYCYAGWKPVVFDALLLAAAIEYCDRIKKRPARGWGRKFELSMPVHEPNRWNASPVLAALQDTLDELTGDRWEISFRARKNAVDPIEQGLMDLPDASLVVIPFSDGMDSRAVAAIVSRTLGGKLIRVRLGSKHIDRPRQGQRKLPFTTVPFNVPGDHFSETSCRSRGFKFAVVSGLAAWLSGAQRIIVPESGQGALGPVLVPVVHAQPDCRNHPIFMRKMERFIGALLNHQVWYEFPRLWFTKGETLRASLDAGDDSWKRTRSCWQRNRQMSVNNHLRQCGFCAACMLRRMSVHAAGLSEPNDTYMYEDLAASTLANGIAAGFELGRSQREYALAGILHLDHLGEFQHSAAQAPAFRRNVSQLSAALDMASADVEANLRRLLSRHEAEWKAFLESLAPGSFIRKRSLQAA
jgi:hypothetical protein